MPKKIDPRKEVCSHYRAAQAGPTSAKRGEPWKTPHRCPDCGFRWVEERDRRV